MKSHVVNNSRLCAGGTIRGYMRDCQSKANACALCVWSFVLQVKGLYMVGASARPGNGVPLVMIGAELLVRRIMPDVNTGKLTSS